jgi:hypothetical protein
MRMEKRFVCVDGSGVDVCLLKVVRWWRRELSLEGQKQRRTAAKRRPMEDLVNALKLRSRISGPPQNPPENHQPTLTISRNHHQPQSAVTNHSLLLSNRFIIATQLVSRNTRSLVVRALVACICMSISRVTSPQDNDSRGTGTTMRGTQLYHLFL